MSFMRSLPEVQGHLTHVHALAQGVRRVYFMGGVTNMDLMRRYLFEEIKGRNLLRPEVGGFHITRRKLLDTLDTFS